MNKNLSVLFMTAKFLGLKENRKESGRKFSFSPVEASDVGGGRGKNKRKPHSVRCLKSPKTIFGGINLELV
jgi:hypothetical protein